MNTVTITDEVLGSSERNSFVLSFLDERISAQECIRRRIYEEVMEYNLAQQAQTEQSGQYQGLVKPIMPQALLDWERQYAVALEGFNRNAFIMLVNDQQIEHLEQSFDLRTATAVTFLKLVPLVGG